MSRLLSRTTAQPQPTKGPIEALHPLAPRGRARYAVIDTETTGLSAGADRVIELAIVLLDGSGRRIEEWVSRFDPEGPVGAVHIHGIRPEDLAGAPRFVDRRDEVANLLSGVVVVGHNIRFDAAFLHAEFLRTGHSLPPFDTVCTLELAQRLLPDISRHRLSDCCDSLEIPLIDAHSALGDARATGALLERFLQEAVPARTSSEQWTGQVRLRGRGRRYDDPRVREMITRRSEQDRPARSPLLESVTEVLLEDALDEGAPAGSLPYLELLTDALQDGVLVAEEVDALNDLRDLWNLGPAAISAAEDALLRALAHLALDDGRVSRDERNELLGLAVLLDRPTSVVSQVLGDAEAARLLRLSEDLVPLPLNWALGQPLRVGDKVAVTGCDWSERSAFEERAHRLGVRISGSVSARTSLLVSDGSFAGTKASDALRHSTRVVSPAEFALLLDHLQPARGRSEEKAPATAGPSSSFGTGARATGAEPSAVRAWARSVGREVGERGRLPSSLIAAYEQAHR